ncbi:aminotransferase class I/II-fold pyridoxal phosphate-dependent enzyme [Vibrio parahaemolyticus]|uniref:O-acetylhomoserine aminocarboxypropyltransferase n=1 Tax=Vibrio parahaemolyticus TaxID=670 RepID=A0AAW3IQV8_VIBPH|nr:aminotransferase class I/II-fold pyridoxal phosphate-dependent enzyme [Vibrio parahaemolyticus]KOY26755.1 O-acetylhomoserine aminocarboxypropyltransferase [Vibrio parahaemolyticus]MCS0102249.1 aminotransferase class I/II-fold pyridoxal phosphate-dependent enzyme [Vibrio parahaemolyticus]OTW20154.1 O-acetylhomoserine aminocarboxypropyltransferase [Vibrio parahaemolyticus]
MKDETLSIHFGYETDPTTKSVATPIYQTVAYEFDNAQHGADLFNLEVPGNIYTRIMNPTNDVLEKRMAALEGGIAGLVVSAGSAAINYAILTLAQAGDNIVSTPQLYGGTYTLFAHMLPNQGIQVKFAKDDKPESLAELIDENTKAVYCESIGNPAGNIVDLERVAELAHAQGVPVIVDSGKFPWAQHKDRFPVFNQPEPSYHGVVYTEAFGEAAFIGRARTVPLRNTGSTLSPMNAFMLMQGLETLPLRMERHTDNALKVAEFLEQHDKVSWVSYAGLPSSAHFNLAEKYMKGKPSAILSFGLKDGYEAGVRFYDALKIFKRLVNIGDAKSLACHPASTTHRQLSEAEQKQAGVSPEMIRLSVGIEHIDDILADLEQALNA